MHIRAAWTYQSGATGTLARVKGPPKKIRVGTFLVSLRNGWYLWKASGKDSIHLLFQAIATSSVKTRHVAKSFPHGCGLMVCCIGATVWGKAGLNPGKRAVWIYSAERSLHRAIDAYSGATGGVP